uniref:Uncharacterized protein n=1 Tax=Compsopogon caeruleus TaxID=31354 RepID=A0A7S1T6W7_9RHOD|mmetsp:Transcript_11961/g.24360  ORF Transcript_11961/g.24360 Transcript_11961/m.24360 type:complete len:363 (+) Transcript_11961:3-1091(+)
MEHMDGSLVGGKRRDGELDASGAFSTGNGGYEGEEEEVEEVAGEGRVEDILGQSEKQGQGYARMQQAGRKDEVDHQEYYQDEEDAELDDEDDDDDDERTVEYELDRPTDQLALDLPEDGLSKGDPRMTQPNTYESVAKRYSRWIEERGLPKCDHKTNRREGSVLCPPCRAQLKKYIAKRCGEFGCPRSCARGILSDTCNVYLSKAINAVAKGPNAPPVKRRSKLIENGVSSTEPKRLRPSALRQHPPLRTEAVQGSPQEVVPAEEPRPQRPKAIQVERQEDKVVVVERRGEARPSPTPVSQPWRDVGIDRFRLLPAKLVAVSKEFCEMRARFDSLCDELATARMELQFALELTASRAPDWRE